VSAAPATAGRRLLFVVNESHFFLSHRLPVARAAQEAGFEVHVAAPDDHVWAPDGFDVAELARHGFVHHGIPLSRRGANPFEDATTFLAILRLLRRLRPELVHLLTIKPVLYGGVAARLAGAPAVVAGITGLGHAFVAQGLRAALLRMALRGLYRLALAHRNCAVIAQNRADRAALTERGFIAAERVALIRGSGVPLDEFTPSSDPGGEPIAVLPARLIWEKGIGAFAEAARRLKAAGVAGRCVLVGATRPQNPRAVPAAVLEGWAKEGVVEWWGRREDMPAVLAQSHVVCLPSGYGEGVPRSLIEAAASARPIVATDIPGCREIARHGENALLVPPGDPGALADALARLFADRELRMRLGAAGRRIAEAEFSADEVGRRTLALYEKLLCAATRP
jgi:glycosyltransferase involved in cell wall biosynthesis